MGSLDNKEILITGGTGSLGKQLIAELAKNHKPRGIRIYSRDELKQSVIKATVCQEYHGLPISFILGDIRDLQRVKLATRGVDIIIHAAALKQVPACEENPLEAIKTNIIGSQNILLAAIENKVDRVMGISTDKACSPSTLYGATKMAMERLFVNGNIYTGYRTPRFSCCRYGNVIGSRGSVIPIFKEQVKTGKLTVTDKNMTRFWMTIEQAAKFVLNCIENMHVGEIFIPKLKACKIMDIAQTIAGTVGPAVDIVETGIRPGEKLHEILISDDEGIRAYDAITHFCILPSTINGKTARNTTYSSGDIRYTMTQNEIKEMCK